MEHNKNWWLDKDNFNQMLTPHHTSDETWDSLFMRIAKEIAGMSKCASRQFGSVLVRGHDIIAIGVNGAPAGSSLCQDVNGVCPRKTLGFPSGQGLEICPAQHSEENTIAMAARKGVATEGATLYCYCGIPCQRCAGALINAGVKRVVCLDEGYHGVNHEGNYDEMGEMLFAEAGVKLDRLVKESV